MDPEQYKLIQEAVSKGFASAQWLLILMSLIAAGGGSFLGSYLKKKAENLATKEDFEQFLAQLKKQTEATEKIKGEVTEQTASSIERLRAKLAEPLESFKNQLQLDREKELESLRTALRVATHEQETRFSEWHQRQATTLAELYRLLVQAEETLRPSLQDLQAAPIAESWDTREKLRKYFEENKVLIPDHIERRVDYLLNRLSQVLLRKSIGDIDSSEKQVIASVTGTEIPQLLEDIRLQVRIVLSGKSDSPLDVTKHE
jgi:hypothetical protein